MKILILSNGKGEDALAVTLLRAMDKNKESSLEICALPTIGNGSAYTAAGYNSYAVKAKLPSHGFTGLNLFALLKDMRAGLIGITLKQIKIIKKLSGDSDLIICVGDIYPVLLASLFTKKTIIHLATAISVKFRKFNWIEKRIFKNRCKTIFTRDSETATHLTNKNIKAKYLGNIMMDDPNLIPDKEYLESKTDKKVLGLIPSARQDAYSNIKKMLSLISIMKNPQNMEFLLSFAPTLTLSQLEKEIKDTKWKISYDKIISNNISIKIINGNIGNVLKNSDIAIGMTGTGNEQAAGLGIPLVLIKTGHASSRARIRQYEKILGNAVIAPIGSDSEIAKKIEALLKDEKKLSFMSNAGKEIMGGIGAAERIAKEILKVKP